MPTANGTMAIDYSRAVREFRELFVSMGTGTAFGAATSLSNDAASPYGVIGAHIPQTVWSWAAEFASLILDSGWAWAALAVAVGCRTTRWTHGAMAGMAALGAASLAYFACDALFQDVSLSWGELGFWWVASVLFGLPLGIVGVAMRRPGLIGLFAGLVVPLGATMQMIVLPPRPDSPAGAFARAAVCASAALAAIAFVIWWRNTNRRRHPTRVIRPWDAFDETLHRD
jgi:hypothetical protein